MSVPYGLQITENCLICKLRHSGFFCELPKDSLSDLEKIKYASAFPQGAVLFVEGQSARGAYIICSGRVKLSTTSRLRWSGLGGLTHLFRTFTRTSFRHL